MGKSITGGTRSYLRGRVGSDVYSIGRNAKGKKQQVVRSLAESVANPQTESQMRGRMIMSTIMQVVAKMKPIIDHSFDNVTGKQPNISEFIARNYGLIKADVAANPQTSNVFGLVKYGEKGAKRGQYVVSAGQATLPSALVLTKSTATIAITLPADAITGAGLRSALGLAEDEYFTLVGITASGEAAYERFRIAPSLADDAAISSGNVGDCFAIEGNAQAEISLAGRVISIVLTDIAGCSAVIISKKVDGAYIHNDAQLGDGSAFDYSANVALPTYPTGNADFLNGGNIYGQQETQPVVVVYPSLTALTLGSESLLAQSDSVANDAGSKINGTCANLPDSGTLSLYVGSTKLGDISAATFEFNYNSHNLGVVTLQLNGAVIQTCGSIFNSQD